MSPEQLILETDADTAKLIQTWISDEAMVQTLERRAQSTRQTFEDYRRLTQVLFPKAIAQPQSQIIGGTIDEAVEKLRTIEGVGVESVDSFEPKADCVYMGMHGSSWSMHKIERAVVLYPETPAVGKRARADFAAKVLAAFGKGYSGKTFEPQFEGDFPIGGLSYQHHKKAIPHVQHSFPYIELAAIDYSDKPAVFTWDDGQGAHARLVGIGITLAPCKSIAQNMQKPTFRTAFIYGTMPTDVRDGKSKYCDVTPSVCGFACPYEAKLVR